jgi:hypothetical protein
MALPPDCDSTKIAEAAIGLLYLTLHGKHPDLRAWKGLDWDVMDVLFENGWILDPKGKARSVVVTKEGEVQAKLMFEKHFASKQ